VDRTATSAAWASSDDDDDPMMMRMATTTNHTRIIIIILLIGSGGTENVRFVFPPTTIRQGRAPVQLFYFPNFVVWFVFWVRYVPVVFVMCQVRVFLDRPNYLPRRFFRFLG
jgi:hypothetical protein